MLEEELRTVASAEIGKASRINDASGRYIEFCKSTIPSNLKLNGIKIVLDCAHGATYQVAPSVFRELGATVSVLANEPNGLNINKECGSTNPAQLIESVINEGADLGIAFDGDGDRVIMVDHTGATVDGDELLFIIARSRLNGDKTGQGVIGTEMSNLGLELALKSANIPFRRTKVGDRYVMSELLVRQWRYGGESSGHIICLDSTTTGDGLVSALQVLRAMRNAEMTLHEIKSDMEKLPQTMINVRVDDKKSLDGNKRVSESVKDVESTLGQEGRVLLRPSGTEPVVRVMVEGTNKTQVQELAEKIAAVVEAEATKAVA